MTREELIAQIVREKSKLTSMHPIEPYEVEIIVDTIIECIKKLIDLASEESGNHGRYVFELQSLMHTRRKEVNFLRNYCERANKPKAAKVRQVELDQFYAQLVARINRETILFK